MKCAMTRRALGALLICGAAASPGLVSATTCTWTGGGANANWSTVGNWNNTGNGCHGLTTSIPAAGDDLVFPAGAARLTNSNNLAADTAFNSISFTGAGGGYAINGNRIALNAANISQGLSAFGINTLATDLVLSGITGVSMQGSMGSELYLTGTVSGSGGFSATGSLNVQNSVSLSPPAGNTYSGGTTLSLLFVYAGHAAAFGTGTVSIPNPAAGATIQLNGLTIPNAAHFAGNGYSGNGVIGGLTGTWSGPITLTAFTGMGTSGHLSVTGKISGAFGLTAPIAGSGGSMTLSADNDYTGLTQAGGVGTLYINGSQPQSNVTVQPNCTLGGGGTVGSVSLDPTAARLAPGGGRGIINTGNLTVPPGSQLSIDLSGPKPGADHDQVGVTGTVELGGSLALSLSFIPTNGNVFTIIKNDGVDAVVGNFAGLPEGATFALNGVTFKIRYAGGTGNDVTLTVVSGGKPPIVVPEFLLLLLG